MGIIGSILGDLIKPITNVIGEVVVDKDKKAEINLELQKLIDQADKRYHEEMMGQIEVNKVEAVHPSIFVAGWRPYIGWGCGTAFLYSTVISPVFGTPPADIAFVQTVLMAMLGVGAMRSYEKVKGVETKSTAPLKK